MWSYCQGRAEIMRFQNSLKSARLPAIGDVTIGMASIPIIDDSLPQAGNRPALPFKLHTPQKWAGILTLPPTSVPTSILLPPQARRAAPPPVDPPAVNSELYGLDVQPKMSETVSIATRPVGTVVFTCTRAPVSWSKRTRGEEVTDGRPTLRE